MRRLLYCLLLAVASACSSPPAAPSRPVDAAGVWTGNQTLVTCSYPNCGTFSGPPGPQAVRLTLNAGAAELTGTLDLLGTWDAVAGVPITATQSSGASSILTVRGAKTWAFSCFGTGPEAMTGRFEIRSWRSTIDANTGRMSVTFAYTITKHLTSCYYSDITVSEAEATLTRAAF